MGMSYELYWYGDVWLVGAYREADRIRQERTNETAWLNGVYIGAAINSTIGNAFREKGKSKAEYPEKPIPLRKNERGPEDEEIDALKAQIYMNNFVRAGKSWGKPT